MRRTWKILIALLVALAVLLVVNTLVVDGETKDAEVTIDGGRILSLPGGDVQVFEEGAGRAAPIVLLHCYSCSLHWWDGLAPILAEDHRVIRIDLLGHGGSQKPSGGYGIDEQAGLVAGRSRPARGPGRGRRRPLDGLLGRDRARRARQPARRPPGQHRRGPERGLLLAAVHRQARLHAGDRPGDVAADPDFAIEDGYADAFAPGYDLADGFPNPDQVVDDFRAMTYTSFNDANDAAADYVSEATLDQRLRQIPVPLLSIFGAEDQICDPETSQAAYGSLPGARVAEVRGAGHSPNVEQPEETAALIERFAAGAG